MRCTLVTKTETTRKECIICYNILLQNENVLFTNASGKTMINILDGNVYSRSTTDGGDRIII